MIHALIPPRNLEIVIFWKGAKIKFPMTLELINEFPMTLELINDYEK